MLQAVSLTMSLIRRQLGNNETKLGQSTID